MAKAQRKLHELYRTSEVLVFDDGTDDPITVQIVKLNQPDKEAIIRRANAARARTLASRSDRDGDEYLATMANVAELDDPNDLVNLIVMPEMAEAIMSIEAELTAEKEWADEDYLSGLRDAWTGTDDEPGMETRWLDSEADGADADPEAKKVFDELSRFNDELTKRVTAEREAKRDTYIDLDLDTLRDKTAQTLIKMNSDQVFNDEYIRQRAYYSTRDPKDRRKRYFETLADWDDCSELVQTRIIDAYDRIAVEGVEGKELPGTPGSSPPSESPVEVELSTDSGLVDASTTRTSPTSS